MNALRLEERERREVCAVKRERVRAAEYGEQAEEREEHAEVDANAGAAWWS